jgi:hypothetical protein
MVTTLVKPDFRALEDRNEGGYVMYGVARNEPKSQLGKAYEAAKKGDIYNANLSAFVALDSAKTRPIMNPEYVAAVNRRGYELVRLASKVRVAKDVAPHLSYLERTAKKETVELGDVFTAEDSARFAVDTAQRKIRVGTHDFDGMDGKYVGAVRTHAEQLRDEIKTRYQKSKAMKAAEPTGYQKS